MKKQIVMLLLTVLCTALLCACSGAALPDGMTQDSVKTLATQSVDALSAQDYATLDATLTQEMKDAFAAKPLADIWAPFAIKLGSFVEMKSIQVSAQNDYAVAVATAKYESGTVRFTLSYNSEGQLAGLYFK